MSTFDADPLPSPALVPPTGGPEDAKRVEDRFARGGHAALSQEFTGDPDIPLDDAGPADTELADVSPMDNILDLLRTEFVPVEKTYGVPTRPGLALTFRTDLSQDHMDAFRKQAQKGRRSLRPGVEPDVDGAKFASLMIAQYCVGLAKVDGATGQGVPVLRSHLVPGSPDERVHFGHRELLTQLGAKSRAEGVRKLFGQDGPLIAMSNQLLNDSGLMDEMDETAVAGPTDGP